MKKKMRQYRTFLIAVVGVLLMLAGIYRQEVRVFYKKAIHICLECVGIG